MALEFSSAATMLDRVSSDHQAHLRTISRVLAGAIAARLNDRTARIDGRNGARARSGKIGAYRTATGTTGYSITVTQNILPDVVEAKRKQIQQQQAVIKSMLASKNGVMGLLRSGGVH